MRWVDRWVGIPACFLLTIVRRVSALFSSRALPAPQNVLFIELAEMGSLVLAQPAVAQLRRTYPAARPHFLVFKGLKDSVVLLGHAQPEDVFTIDPSNLFTIARDALRFMAAARRRRIDTAINLEMFTRVSSILMFMSGARTTVGFHGFTQPGLYIGGLLTHRVAYNPHIHTSQAFLALVESLGSDPANLPLGKFRVEPLANVPKLATDPAAQARILSRVHEQNPNVAGKRLLLINPNASPLIEIRKWPLDNYVDLVRRLLADPANACVMTGVLAERPDAQAVISRVNSDRIVDMTGRTSFKELIDLYNVADLLVTNDSGPAQFAALTNIDVVVFFGPETPKLYGPLTERSAVMYSGLACSPCVSAYNQRLTPCTDNQCLKQIPVDTVYGRIQQLLHARTA
jgi:ADP-heptose:LPS heptosyltransferase